MCPLTHIIKNIFNQFFEHFLASLVRSDVESQDTEFGENILNSFCVVPINVFKNQNKS